MAKTPSPFCIRRLSVLCLIFVANMMTAPTLAGAQSCEDFLTTSQDVQEPAKSAIQYLERGSVFSPQVDLISLRTEVVSAYDVRTRAGQTWVNRRIEYEHCLTSLAAGVSAAQLNARMKDMREILYRNAGRGPILTTTYLDRPKTRTTLTRHAPWAYRIDASYDLDAADGWARLWTAQAQKPSYIFETPFVVIEGNRYFVIVASIIDRQRALAKAEDLNRSVDELTFVVYPPYRDNPHHSVMAATWVDEETAYKVRGLAQSLVASDSYIWACPRNSTFC